MTDDHAGPLQDVCRQLAGVRAAADAALAARLTRVAGGAALPQIADRSTAWFDLLEPVLTAPIDSPALFASIRVVVEWAAAHQYRPDDLSAVMRAVDWVLRDLFPDSYTTEAAAGVAARAMLLVRIATRRITPRNAATPESPLGSHDARSDDVP